MFNFNHLYYFYVTAKTGSVTGAAKKLRISQPSLSAQLRTLQGSIGRRLFRKVGRALRLTLDGETVYGFCTQIFELAQELEDTLAAHPRSGFQRIRIGVSTEVDRLFVADVVSDLIRDEPVKSRLNVTMSSGSHPTLTQRLTDGEVDAILTTYAAADDHLQTIQWGMPVHLMVAASTVKRVRKSGVRARDLGSVELALKHLPLGWAMPAWGSKLRNEIQIFLEQKRLSTRCVFESDVLASVFRAITDGVGIGLLPSGYVRSEIQDGRLAALGPKEGFWSHRIWLIGRRSDPEDPAWRRVGEAISAALKARTYL